MSRRYELRAGFPSSSTATWTILPYDGPISIRAAVLVLQNQAEQPTRNRRPLVRPVLWCSGCQLATSRWAVPGAVLGPRAHGEPPSGNVQAMTKQWLSQEQIDERMRERIAGQLSKDIAAYDGSPGAAKEISSRAGGGARDGDRPRAVRGRVDRAAPGAQRGLSPVTRAQRNLRRELLDFDLHKTKNGLEITTLTDRSALTAASSFRTPTPPPPTARGRPPS